MDDGTRPCRACGTTIADDDPRRVGNYCDQGCAKWARKNPGQTRTKPPKLTECSVCDAPLPPDRKLYCSSACGSFAHRYPGEKRLALPTCLACDRPLTGRQRDATVCDARCDHWVRTHPDGEKIPAERRCADCGADISHRAIDARFCSQTCSNRAWRRERMEHVRAVRREHGHRRRDRKLGNGGAGVTEAEWEALVATYDSRCAYCEADDRKLTQDHVVPLSKGGRHEIENLLPACRPCNQGKGVRSAEEWRATLASRAVAA